MTAPSSISVVLPTYNCRPLLVAHLRSMQAWLDLVDEVVVVDSRSTDGTLALIREELRHPRLRIIERDRGLYSSWNEGIAATSGDWVYISTAGETITRDQLLHLREVGEALAADVVVSPPRFVHEDGRPHRDLDWPPGELNRRFGRGRPFVIAPTATQYLAFQSCPKALLGSSASDLYRGAHLRARPFPSEYGVVGDTAWIMRYGRETRLAVTPRIGSTFCIHAKETSLTPTQCVEVHQRMLHEEVLLLRASRRPLGRRLEAFLAAQSLPDKTKELWAKKRALWHQPERRIWNKIRWLGATARYLWHRSRLKLQRRQADRALRAEAHWFTHL